MILHSTVTGYSHLESGKECQDYSATWQNRTGSIKIAVVSDGHGGEEYINSALGARLACKIAVETLKEVAISVRRISHSNAESLLKSISRSIIARWNETVENLRGKDSVKSFGCTLIAYLQTSRYWIGLQIGDGKFAIFDIKRGWSQPIPWDDRCILNYTTSLCDENAMDGFRFSSGFKTPDAVFLSSDGIDGTFEDGCLLYNFYDHVYMSACRDGAEKISADLPVALSHFSEVGSHDDMSLVAVINTIYPYEQTK